MLCDDEIDCVPGYAVSYGPTHPFIALTAPLVTLMPTSPVISQSPGGTEIEAIFVGTLLDIGTLPPLVSIISPTIP
jgi:hypothetical protein